MISVSGLIGGHSGQEINKGRANANILLGRVLDALVQKLPVRLVSAAGGRKDNAIPNAAEALLAIDTADLASAEAIAAEFDAAFRKEYAAADPGVTVTLAPAEAAAPVSSKAASSAQILFFIVFPSIGKRPAPFLLFGSAFHAKSR